MHYTGWLGQIDHLVGGFGISCKIVQPKVHKIFRSTQGFLILFKIFSHQAATRANHWDL